LHLAIIDRRVELDPTAAAAAAAAAFEGSQALAFLRFELLDALALVANHLFLLADHELLPAHLQHQIALARDGAELVGELDVHEQRAQPDARTCGERAMW
jgi:hypothetical protein